eukprot:8173857-Lingulodinium_polyedra.AAC.1
MQQTGQLRLPGCLPGSSGNHSELGQGCALLSFFKGEAQGRLGLTFAILAMKAMRRRRRYIWGHIYAMM